jgi:tRNA uridine 5-carbamoylmethylation protein Kti12
VKVIVLRGTPGSGKSWLAKKLGAELEAQGYKVRSFSADYFFTGSDGTYRFDRSKLAEAHASCLRGFTKDLLFCHQWPQQQALIVDNTHTTSTEVAPYAQLALAFGAELDIVLVKCDQKVAFERQTHGTPKKVHEEMFRRLERSQLPPYWPQRVYHTEV